MGRLFLENGSMRGIGRIPPEIRSTWLVGSLPEEIVLRLDWMLSIFGRTLPSSKEETVSEELEGRLPMEEIFSRRFDWKLSIVGRRLLMEDVILKLFDGRSSIEFL